MCHLVQYKICVHVVKIVVCLIHKHYKIHFEPVEDHLWSWELMGDSQSFQKEDLSSGSRYFIL